MSDNMAVCSFLFGCLMTVLFVASILGRGNDIDKIHKDAIEAGIGMYHPETGDFTFKECDHGR